MHGMARAEACMHTATLAHPHTHTHTHPHPHTTCRQSAVVHTAWRERASTRMCWTVDANACARLPSPHTHRRARSLRKPLRWVFFFFFFFFPLSSTPFVSGQCKRTRKKEKKEKKGHTQQKKKEKGDVGGGFIVQVPSTTY